MARPGLDKHPKFRRLIFNLGETRALARGLLECLWETAYETGNPRIGDSIDVELAADWHGEPGKLTNALSDCGGDRPGFIELVNGAWEIHDLYANAPEYVQKRMGREAERNRKGVTISELRAEAGRKGGKANRRQPEANDEQTEANGSNLLQLAKQPEANDRTPAPAPAPAPAPNEEDMSAGADPSPEIAKPEKAEAPKGLTRLITLWNAIPDVQHCREATSKRITAYRQRSRNDHWMTSVAGALTKISESDFCRGKNDRGWLADIDWFLKPDTATKIMEGKYDNHGGKARVASIPTGGEVVFNSETGEFVLKKV